MLRNLDQVGVSVALCCFNSEQRILPTLDHLSRQVSVAFPWEILIIDNASTDRTVDVAEEFWKKEVRPCSLRVINEQRKGTMFARATAIREANFRYLLYCDDDNWLSENYVSLAYDSIVKDQEIAAIGGNGEMVFDINFTPPAWLTDYTKGFGIGPQGKSDGDTTNDKGCLYTAGAILDRVWLDRLFVKGFESMLKGRDGKSLVAGEDTELTYALNLLGGQLHYRSGMRFKHYMPQGRLTWSYLKRLWNAFGYSDLLLLPYKVKLHKRRNRGKVRIFISTSITLVQLGLILLFEKRKEGNAKVLHFERKLGALKALLTDATTMDKCAKMTERLTAGANGKV